ncbi:hypothetical protein [Streptomyces sp. NRRL S-1448]|uniref:hypothetical protein n=1 Tax=Streptomyces sp. NRRL S-1448 TaxID=1463883 RepID=UPI0004C06567|nr:hypothetical protein [Streptomyces sp. NRRL S-1448]
MDLQDGYLNLSARGRRLAARLNTRMASLGIHLEAMGDVPSGTTARVRLGTVDEATAKRLLAVAQSALSEHDHQEQQ